MHRQRRPRRRPPLPRRRRGHHRADRRPLHPRPRRRPLVPHRHRRQVVARDAGLAGRQRHHQGDPDHAGAAGTGRAAERADPPAFADIEHPINLNIGVIHGGDWPSTVPGACELHCRLELLPRSDRRGDPARDRGGDRRGHRRRSLVRASIRRVVSLGRLPERRLDRLDGRAVGAAPRTTGTERVFGAPMEPKAGTGINDMRYYNFVGIPAGCYGAAGGNGHAADEWLDLRSLAPAAKVLGAFMLDWCGVASVAFSPQADTSPRKPSIPVRFRSKDPSSPDPSRPHSSRSGEKGVSTARLSSPSPCARRERGWGEGF